MSSCRNRTKLSHRLPQSTKVSLTPPGTRYQQEEAEKRARQEREQREEAEQRRRERVAEEGVLRDKLIRNVHQLERRRKEVQRELVLRNISESGSSSRDRRRRSPREHGHGASGAVVAPRHHRH